MRVLGLVLCALALAPASAAAQTPGPCEPVTGDDWCEQWVGTLDDQSGYDNFNPRTQSALSPDGRQFYMTGFARRPDETPNDNYDNPSDLVTVAFDTATGAKTWTARYPSGKYSVTASAVPGIAVSPDGSKVFVTGLSPLDTVDGVTREGVTLAYNTAPPRSPGDPALGQQLWAKTYTPTTNLWRGLRVTPDGSTVLVSMQRLETDPPDIHHSDVVTVAYDASSGEQRWATTYGVPGHYEAPEAMAVSPDGRFAYVTGYAMDAAPAEDALDPADCGGASTCENRVALTLAYAIQGNSAGKIQWVARFDSNPDMSGGGLTGASPQAQGWHVAVSDDGRRVFVAACANEQGACLDDDGRIAVLAYDAASGEQQWLAEYQGGPGRNLPAFKLYVGGGGLAVTPDNDLVVVTGEAADGASGCKVRCQIPVLAYSQSTGKLIWSQTMAVAGAEVAGSAIASSPDGSLVLVSGTAGKDQVTLAYDAQTGEQAAIARYNQGSGGQFGKTVIASSDGMWVYSAAHVAPDDSWRISSYPMPGDTDLSLAVSAPTEAAVGDAVAYEFRTANLGPDDAADVILRIAVPEGVEVVSAEPSRGQCGTADNGRVTCRLGSLADTGTATVRVVVTPSGPGTLLTTAQAFSPPTDPHPENNLVAVATQVHGEGTPLPPVGELSAALMHPIAGEQVSSAPGSALPVSGAVRFEEPTPADTKFYIVQPPPSCLPRTLSTVRRTTLRTCGHAESVTPVNELLPERVEDTFPTVGGNGTPLTLDASRPLSGVVEVMPAAGVTATGPGIGAGLTTVDVTVTGVQRGAASSAEQTLGTDSETFIATPEKMSYLVPWSAQLSENVDRADFASLTLRVVIRGYNAGYGAIGSETSLTVPTYSASFDRHVEVAVDDGPFTSDAVTVSDDLTSWATKLPMPALGRHTIRARAVQGWRTSPAAARSFTVAG